MDSKKRQQFENMAADFDQNKWFNDLFKFPANYFVLAISFLNPNFRCRMKTISCTNSLINFSTTDKQQLMVGLIN